MMDQIKKLRSQTGAGIAACKAALVEAEGDLEASVDILRTKGLADLAKKSDRATNEGAIAAFTSDNASVGSLIEVNCETDFVGSNEEFTSFVADLALLVAENNPASVEDVLGYTYPGRDINVEGVLGEKVSKLGENINIARFDRAEVAGSGAIATYIHPGAKIGVLVNFAFNNEASASNETFNTFARDVAMQIAAADPIAVTRDDFDPAVVERELAIYKAQAEESGKPENIQEMMAQGRMKKFYSEQALIEQAFVKDDSISVGDLAKNVGKEIGDEITIVGFTRYTLGGSAE